MASHLPTQASPRQGAAAPRTPKEVVSHGGKPHSKQSGHLANARGGTGFVSNGFCASAFGRKADSCKS